MQHVRLFACFPTDKDAEVASALRVLHRVVRACVAQADEPGTKLLWALWDALRPAFSASAGSIYLNKVEIAEILFSFSLNYILCYVNVA